MHHIWVPRPPRLPTGKILPSMCALRRAPGVLKPQYPAASLVVRYFLNMSPSFWVLHRAPPLIAPKG